MTVRNPYRTKPKKPRNSSLHWWFTHQKRIDKYKMARRQWSPASFNKKVLRNKRRRPTYKRYQKRNTSRRPTTKTIRNKIMNKNYLGYLNPFLTTHVSRIPDAAVTHSMPVQHRVIDEIVPPKVGTGEDPKPQPTTHIFIYPGLEGGCVFINDDELADSNLPYVQGATQAAINLGRFPAGHDMAYGQNEHHPSNGVYMDVKTTCKNTASDGPQLAFQHCPDQTEPGNTRQRLELNSGISKFRVTSQALKLTLLNTDQENDGWWEAVRIPYQPQMDHWRLNFPDFIWDTNAGNLPAIDEVKVVKATTSKASLEPSIKLFNEYQEKNIAQHNSYESGSLKFLSSRYFILGHQSPNNDFQHLEQNYKLEVIPSLEYLTNISGGVTPETGYYPGDGNLFTGAVKLDKGAPAAKQLFRSMYDTSLDMLYIRVHPGSQGSRVLAELLTNHEVVYGADTALSKYQLMTPRKSSSLFSWQKDKTKITEKSSFSPTPMQLTG